MSQPSSIYQNPLNTGVYLYIYYLLVVCLTVCRPWFVCLSARVSKTSERASYVSGTVADKIYSDFSVV